MNKKRWFSVMSLLMIIIIFLSLSLGAVHLTFGQLLTAIMKGTDCGLAGSIFWYVRLPRTIACLLAGLGLSVSGLVIQNVLSNKLASPSIIGVNAGAGLAVTVCCAFGWFGSWLVTGSAFIAAMLTVFMIVMIARKMNASRTTVILIGVAVNSFLNAICEAIITLIPEVAIMSSDFRVGGFSSVTISQLLPAGIFIISGFLILLTLCNELDLMNMGEETAHSLGLSVKNMRTCFLALAALLSGASVSFSGLLGFVGLIVPHISRKLIGGESRYLLPFSAITGAFFVTLCDLISRLLFLPYEIPVGILMSFLGGPFFVFLLLKNKGGRKHA